MKLLRKLGTVSLIIALIASIAFTLYANKEKAAENARIVERNVQSFPVALAEAKKATVSRNFQITGTFEPYRELSFASEVQGRVIQVLFDQGYIIAEGQVLAQLDDEDLRRELRRIQLGLERRKKDLSRFENLAQNNATTGKQVDDARFEYREAELEIEEIKKQIAKTLIKAPISGTINQKMIEKGSYLQPGTPIAEITDISSLKMLIKVSDKEALKIQPGQSVRIESDVHAGVTYAGTVKSIAAKADDSKRFAIEISLLNQTANPLKAGMYGTAYFDFRYEGQDLLIPRKAILGSLKDAYVYVVDNQQIAHRRKVQTGSTFGDQVSIIEGLKAGEKVVITGQINLQEGSKVSIL
ncbi:MAG: efflux RND transporter periplasmic adaptor subunit [Microscillaceae bacterium]|nr:efflux RND transporter periplasmic adaptor subunit [Microscillaceae bacterium]